MKILFTHSYFLCFDTKQNELNQPYPPLATIYAASLLREEGFDVCLFDSMFAQSPEEILPVIETESPDLVVIYDDGFNYLTKMCLTNMREAAFKITHLCKEKHLPVVINSSDSTDHYQKYIYNGADYVITGEGELSLLELVRALDEKSGINEIKGLIYKDGLKIKINQRRDVFRNLDKLPFPAWDLIDIKKYKDTWIRNHGYFSLNLVTTRGCPYKCNWCAKPIYGNRYNSHSPEYIVNHLKQLISLYAPDHIWFCDDILGLKPGWIKEFAILIEKAEIKIKYRMQSRADILMDEELVKSLATSGCQTIWIGAESGSQKILDAMNKGIKVSQIYRSSLLLRKYKIQPAFFIQFGYPGEMLEDIYLTLRMMNDLVPEDIGISISYPLPGTVFHDKVKEELKGKANWTESDELALMFQNTFSPGFYRQLHRYVHKNYRKYQSFDCLLSMLRGKMLNRQSLRRAMTYFYYIPAVFLERRKLNKLLNE